MHKRILLALLAVATVIAGCGSDDSTTGSTGTTAGGGTSTPSTFPT